MSAPADENRVFLLAHAGLLAIVLLGFSRSLYLAPWLSDTPLGPALLTHGALLTSWFALAVMQGVLIARRRRAAHGRVAWLAAALVACVVVSSAWINTGVAAQIASPGDPRNMFVWANYMTLVAFVGLVSAAVLARRRPEAHRRLLLLASIAIIGPALGRIALWPVFGLGVDGAPPFAIGGILTLLVFVLAYDKLGTGQVRRTTMAGAAAIVGALAVGVIVAQSGLPYRLLH